MKIDPSQSDAIRHELGPAMILAGPGSGKTTVITRRVEHMISHLHIDPSSILVITFSRAAAREMRERFLILSGRQRLPVTFGTFHAVFFQILKTAYHYSSSQIVREDQQVLFVRDYIRRLRVEEPDMTDLAGRILSEISLVKNTGTDPMSYSPFSCDEHVFRSVFEAYGEFLRGHRFLDFDDMLVMTKELFEKRPDILAGWQERFSHILVDEFQDINPLQYEIVRMMASPQDNLFIVGDDDQSIYGFRGARPEIMLHFELDYPGVKKIRLQMNYRSTPEIVLAAGSLISHNHSRFHKDIRAASAEGFAPVIKSFPNQREQNRYVTETILKLNREIGIPLDEMAVLFRTNAQPRLLMLQLGRQNIPFSSVEHLPNLYGHWIAEDIRTYISLAMGDRSRASFIRVMNRPSRFLSRESLPYENVSFQVWAQFYRGEERMTERLAKLERDLSVISGLSPCSAVIYIRKAVGYEDYLRECAGRHGVPEEKMFDVLEEIQDDASNYGSCSLWIAHQEEILTRSGSPSDKKEAPPGPAVVLSTLHASKGLEFDTVFLVDVNETVLPDKKAVTEESLEEERRLFYVGMTRAKRRLFILHSGQIKNKEMVPSRFIGECTPS